MLIMESPKFYCNDCKTSYARKYLLTQHLTSKKHLNRTEQSSTSLFSCDCGKSYIQKKSLEYHKKNCNKTTLMIPPTTTAQVVQNDATSVQEIVHEMKQAFEKERQEMKLAFEESMKEQINKILDKHAGTVTTNNNNTNNIETQHINIKITLSATKTPTTSTTNQSWRVLTAFTGPFLLFWKRFISTRNTLKTITSKSPTKNSLMLR